MESDDFPKGWSRRMHETGDLETAYQELEGRPGYLSEACRGRVLSLRGFLNRADLALKRAASMAVLERPQEPETEFRILLMAAWCRENDLLLGRLRKCFRLAPSADLAPESLRPALRYHNVLDVAELLQSGDMKAADEACWTISASGEAGHTEMSFRHICKAACRFNVGEPEDGLRHLDIAGLHARAIDNALSVLRAATRLVSIYRGVGDAEHAREWARVIQLSPCPQRTKEELCARSATIERRSAVAGVLYLL